METKFVFIAIVLFVGACASPAPGATIKADGSGDYPTIQAALDDLPTGSALLLEAGVFTGPGNWDLDFGGKNFDFYGLPANPEEVVFDLQERGGRAFHRAMILDTAGEEGTRFQHVTFRGGRAPGAAGGVAVVMVSWITFNNCIFEDNQADQGGVFHIRNATVNSTDCRYRSNIADEGGVAFLEESSFFVDLGFLNTFANNHANDRGGVFACSEGASGSISLHGGSVFWQNSAAISGGAIYSDGSTWTYIEHVTAVENSAPLASAFHLNFAFDLEYSIIAWGNSIPVQGTGISSQILCNDVFGNTGGDYLGSLTGYGGVDGNISEDPQFCGFGDGFFELQSDSPCSPENEPCLGVLIGALPATCGPQDTDDLPWSAVKLLY